MIYTLKDMRLLDINIYHVNQENGIDRNLLPGLIALTPPRKPARGRESDTLIALASINGAAGITAESLNTWLLKKADQFYQTAGTVTFAMKALVESLNKDLLDRNLRRVKDGTRLSAALSLAVFRRDTVYLVNIGSARSYFANQAESVELVDPATPARGLGVDEMLTCHFAQKEMKENDVLVLTCQPPEVWKAETFTGCASLSTEAVGRRLFNLVGADLKAILIRGKNGKGNISQMTLRNQPTATPAMDKATTSIEAEGSIEPFAQPIAAPMPAPERIAPPQPVVYAEPEEVPMSIPESNTVEAEIDSQATQPLLLARSARHTERARESKKPEMEIKSGPSAVQVSAGKLTKKVVTGVNQTSSAFSRFMQKILPGLADEPLKLSRSALIGIAVGIPLIIVLLAGLVYARLGRTKEFDQHLVMAQQYAMQAELQVNDPPMRLASLQQSIFWLDKAETYGQSDLSTSLRVKVQGELDVMEGIQRLEMAEVVAGGLEAGSNITQIVATATDVYLLDETSGTVKRYFLGSSGYEADEDFDCGPNPDNLLNTLGNVVDMIPLNINNSYKATLLAIDASGNIEYCIPGDAGVIGSLTPPDQGWKKLTSISIYNDYLYVLDINGNAVYRYAGDGVLFESKPTLFFDNQIPPLTEAIDIEVNGDELYILRSNGQMVECTYSPLKDYKLTECVDPALYGDMREGQTPEAITFPEADFIQMRLTAAPDSSIYLLDATSKALYHFSLQRNLQKILHPRLMDGYNLERLSPTAVAVSSGRIAFIAFGNQIYYSPLP